jgi:hypothetical protein
MREKIARGQRDQQVIVAFLASMSPYDTVKRKAEIT